MSIRTQFVVFLAKEYREGRINSYTLAHWIEVLNNPETDVQYEWYYYDYTEELCW